MVIDSSALIAILLGEPEASVLAEAISKDSTRLLSALSALETAVVIENRKGPVGGKEFDLLVRQTGIEIVAMNTEQIHLARQAYAEFGKGRHPAGLNLGDCCSYALARYTKEPLLFKGNDFSKTDILIVKYSPLTTSAEQAQQGGWATGQRCPPSASLCDAQENERWAAHRGSNACKRPKNSLGRWLFGDRMAKNATTPTNLSGLLF